MESKETENIASENGRSQETEVLITHVQDAMNEALNGTPLSKIAPLLLNDEDILRMPKNLTNIELASFLQKGLQENLRSYYFESGLDIKVKNLKNKDMNVPIDEQVLHLIASEGKGGLFWIDILPNLHNENNGIGLNCTFGSALLHIALEELGFDNIFTLVRKGHSVVMRKMEDGSRKLYDAMSTSSAPNGNIVGYSRVFQPSDIENIKNIVGRGFSFKLISGEKDSIGGIINPEEDGIYSRSFFAYESDIKMDIAIAIGNLSEIKDDARVIENDTTVLFDIDGYKEALKRFILTNNQTVFSDEDMKEIISRNTQTIEELLQEAGDFYTSHADFNRTPNPYDFLSSDLLKPKSLDGYPNPKDYVGSSKRYEQARNLCKKYPALKTMGDFETIKRELPLFDGSDYL